ncbi:MAG: transglutaminase-like domain-containing protein [Tenuifilaceae bacterium]|jgi:regulator of sirC expression with transglutaminase-like and TPR domain|nr:transglutaminase-like domain-containing protein [Tenuifilaceae bacterium]
MRPKEFAALVSLLEDPDQEVYKSISNKLVTEGIPLVPLLEQAWEVSDSDILQSRVEDILHKIQLNTAKRNLTDWVATGCADLLAGAVYVAQYQYPDIEYEVVESYIDKLKQKVWMELNESLTALEKVKVLNHILFASCGFAGNADNFFAPQNHFINQLIETKKGGPVLISIFYSLVAQRLGLPIYPVSLPRNFLVAYKNRYGHTAGGGEVEQSILFYINPFNQGSVLARKDIEQFLSQNKIPPKEEYFLPCTNCSAISQLLGSLLLSFQKLGQTSKIDDLKLLLDILHKQ